VKSRVAGISESDE